MRALAAAIGAELRKLWTLWYLRLATALTCAVAPVVARALDSGQRRALAPADIVRTVPDYVQVGLVAIGVLAVTTEYSPRQIAVTLTCVPRRTVVAAAKAVALAGSAAATALVAMLLARAAVPGDWTAAEGVAVLLTSAYLVAACLISAAVGLLARGLVAALTVSLIVLVLAPLALTAFPSAVALLPSAAGAALYGDPGRLTRLGVAGGGVVLLAWTTVLWGAGFVALRRRDA